MPDFPAPPLAPTTAAVEHHLPSSLGEELPEVHAHGVDIPDLDENAEHHLPLLAPDVLAYIPDRLPVLCHCVLGQQVDSLPKECERVIHVLHSPRPGTGDEGQPDRRSRRDTPACPWH